MKPPRLPEGEFSDLFCDFLDKCLKKDQTDRWTVKQLLNHDFILRHCATSAPGRSPGSEPGEDDADAKDEDDESKEQAEVDEIVQKVAEHYFKDAKELISEHDYTLDDIVAWIQLLPAMQKVYVPFVSVNLSPSSHADAASPTGNCHGSRSRSERVARLYAPSFKKP
jgi:serine/threonine protein kinase